MIHSYEIFLQALWKIIPNRKISNYPRYSRADSSKLPSTYVFCVLKANIFPDRATCFDFYFEKKAAGHWKEWPEMISREDMVIPEGVKVVDLIIQTDETARQSFFLQTFISHHLPLLLVGPTGK